MISSLEENQYCAEIVGFHHHKVFLLHDCMQRKPHTDLLDPIQKQLKYQTVKYLVGTMRRRGNLKFQALICLETSVKKIIMLCLKSPTFTQKKQLPQGIMNAPTTWLPMGNLKL